MAVGFVAFTWRERSDGSQRTQGSQAPSGCRWGADCWGMGGSTGPGTRLLGCLGGRGWRRGHSGGSGGEKSLDCVDPVGGANQVC